MFTFTNESANETWTLFFLHQVDQWHRDKHHPDHSHKIVVATGPMKLYLIEEQIIEVFLHN